MKFTLSWLKEHLDTAASIDKISTTLTAIGLEVDDITNHAEALAAFTVAEILEAEKHPDADKLRVCKVKAHDGERTVVCGAPNARKGIKVALADIGVTIPNGGFQIKKSKIRGIESCGMLCSADELGLDGDAAGIIELPADAKIGTAIAPYLGVDDVVFDIAITPNRGDSLGVYGIARDLAAAGLGTLKPITANSFKTSGKQTKVNVKLHSDACPYFVSRTITNITNGASPDWLQQRLKSVGLRSISALVDITNYMTIAYGRPLHVYDANRLKGDIVVRDSKDGESLEALNDKAYTLPAGLCVITDDSGVIGLGGVVGGTSTGCEEDTVNVVLESAWFNPVAIATTGRSLQIDSDARYRFERTVDPEFTATGANIATQLIIDICGTDTTAASELLIAGNIPDTSRTVTISGDDIRAMSGVAIDDASILTILEKLGFTIKKQGNEWRVTSPSYRPDMQLKADIVEEVLRIYGYDNIPELALPTARASTAAKGNEAEVTARLVRRILASRWLDGVYHYAFGEKKHALRFAPESEALSYVEVVNPISADLSIMRTNLLPAMLASAARNIARNINHLGMFELGNVFFGAAPHAQPIQAAAIRTGKSLQHWSKPARAVDVFDAKADALAVLEALGVDTSKVKITTDAPSWYHPGKSGRLSLGGKITLGYFGSVHPEVLRMMDIEQEVIACEVMPENITSKRKPSKNEALIVSDFQATRRDFAFVVDEKTPATDVLAAITNAEKKLLRDVTLFDVYQGKGVESGKKSLALAVTLQADDRTLSEEDITRVSDAIITAAAKLGANLR
jgi:phenylalanyl-tRNA synthetase beta chain